MKIGLIDVDGHNFPNIALMKLSAWHKKQGDSVEWYDPMLSNDMDIVYMSKIFSFTKDYLYPVRATQIIKGGSGYCIKLNSNGVEVYDKTQDKELPYEVEHIYPDYSIYPELTKDTAYGYLTRGCPRGCNFCHVEAKEGRKSYKCADLSEFWNGQKNIILLDQNITACREWKDLFQQLIDSGAEVDFSQGLDIRLMTREKIELLKQIKVKRVHFAWDRYQDKEIVVPKFREFQEITGWNCSKMGVFVLCNFDTTIDQDLDRIYTLRDLGYNPYVMLYNKDNIPKGHKLRQMQRWVNNRIIFHTTKTFEEYQSSFKQEDEVLENQMSLL